MLVINDLCARIDDTEILKGLTLTVNPGDVHAIMGPNGSGKSTLSKVLCGHPDYEVTSGSVSFNGVDILEMEPDERALEGLFMAFQYPVEVPGVNNEEFLRLALNSRRKHNDQPEIEPAEFKELIKERLALVEMQGHLLSRALNHGFSGGEKKRNEILQMAILDPKLSILDETDSGLDIDALKRVSHAVNVLKRSDNASIVITHYQRLLEYIVPDVVHVMMDGKIVETGDKSLALKLEEQGYDWLTQSA